MKKKPASTPADIDSLSLRKFMLSDVLILEKLGVKLIDPTGGAAAGVSINDAVTVVFLLSRPINEIVDLRRDMPRLEAAVAAFASTIGADQIGALTTKLMAVFEQAFQDAKATPPTS